MKAAHRFDILLDVFKRRLKFFRACHASLIAGDDRAAGAWGAHVVIELDNLIVCAFREYLVDRT